MHSFVNICVIRGKKIFVRFPPSRQKVICQSAAKSFAFFAFPLPLSVKK